MNTKHTPGEWFTCRGVSSIYIEARLRQGVVHEIAACGPTEAGHEQQEANARLMAAAPDLLEALKLVIRTCGFQLGESPTFDVAHAAIEKATGASHVHDK